MSAEAAAPLGLDDTPAVREAVQRRVLWLASAIVHWANHVRPNPDRTKIGGHQASSASSVGILTALYFETLTAHDRIAVKPHASPVFHAIQYLLGFLDESWLTTLRQFNGLQAYPSRTKDPDDVHFSTGSMGLGIAATAHAALVREYLASHGLQPASRRFFGHLGDAELDEGSIWETVVDPTLHEVPGLIWIVDVNRQSLDRIQPGIRVARFRSMFQANGWTVLDAKYGHRLEAVFERRGGEVLRHRLDEMSNEEYQALIRQRGAPIRDALLDGAGSARAELSRLLRALDDEELASCLTDLAGHDVAALVSSYSEASAAPGPAVIFAYTFKGHGLPFMSDPMNHSALLTDEQFTELGRQLGEDPAHPWSRFPDDSPEGRYVAAAAERLRTKPREIEPPIEVHDVRVAIPPSSSTQDAFGRVLVELDRSNPSLAAKIVTVSPDVAMTTSLGGWINRASVWSQQERPQFADASERVVQWREGPVGRHIELGISESNLFLLLGQLGLAEELSGHRLVPIGTVYDCFVPRGLEPMMYAAYQGARFIVAATPAGVTLSPEGGAHQSILTPSLGIEIPGVVYYEPCFGQEVAWILVHAIDEVAAGRPKSFYLRLSTKPVDNRQFPADRDPGALRQEVLRGCYRLRRADPNEGEIVHIFAAGIMATEALAAVEPLAEEGISANIFCVTSPSLLFQRSRESSLAELEGACHGDVTCGLVDEDELGLPLVTVIDGHPHTLSFLAGAVSSTASTHLGVSTFGRSGTRDDLYRAFQIDTTSIVAAAIGVADRVRLLPRRRRAPGPEQERA